MSTSTTRIKKTTNKVAKKAPAKKSQSTTKKAAVVARNRTAVKARKGTVAKTTRKKSAKTTGTAVTKKRPVVHASDETSFWTTDGQILNSIVALNAALDDMQEAVYQYHVDKNRHDFADWVELVLGDVECAAALRRAKTPQSARTVMVRHLKFYTL